MKKRILNILIAVLALVFVGSGAFVGVNLLMYHRQQQTFDELAEELPEETAPVIELAEVTPIEVPSLPPVSINTDISEVLPEDESSEETGSSVVEKSVEEQIADALAAYAAWANLPALQENAADEPVYAPLTFSSQEWNSWWLAGFEERQPVYQTLHEQNPDVVGWVRIEGTKINYPVCQTPYDPEAYLHKDVNGSYSSYGTPFMDAVCRLTNPRSSLLIYGHHMRNGSMFAALQNYVSVSYYRAHPYIQFDTMDEPATYQIALVIKVDAEGTYLSWQDILFPEDEEVFNYALWFALANRLYDTGVSIDYDDDLLALVTCEYSQTEGRLMVIAKRIW